MKLESLGDVATLAAERNKLVSEFKQAADSAHMDIAFRDQHNMTPNTTLMFRATSGGELFDTAEREIRLAVNRLYETRISRVEKRLRDLGVEL